MNLLAFANRILASNRRSYSSASELYHKMNVLVYSGPGTTPESVKQCLETLRRFLSPNYAVTSVGQELLRSEPWKSKTSLLVVPGGADLPICKELNGEGNKIIKSFVSKGGKYLGFCSGGYYGSTRCEFEVGDLEMEVSGPRELAFFPGTARGCAYKGFIYNSEAGARAVELEVASEVDPGGKVINYYNGGAVFVDANKYPNVEVLARYKIPIDVPCDETRAAVIYCKVGQGAALLTGTHPEFTPDLMKKSVSDANYTSVVDVLRETDAQRLQFLKNCVKKLGLKVNDDIMVRPRITPLYMTSFQKNIVPALVHTLKQSTDFQGPNMLKGHHDNFRFHDSESSYQEMTQLNKQEEFEDPDMATKEVYVFPDFQVPDRRVTPYFNLDLYYKTRLALSRGEVGEYGFTITYGEVVTSTNTLMDKNTELLRNLPNGFTIVGTTQVSGRGRGGNVWVNPPGVLAFSQVLKLPLHESAPPPVVFVQYVVSISLVEAVLSYGRVTSMNDDSYSKIPIRLKWPNDVYLLKPEKYGATTFKDEPSYVKISGSLVNTNILDRCYYLVVGTGVNISNAAPTTSLNALVDKINEMKMREGQPLLEHFSEPKLLANFMEVFSRLYSVFLSRGFDEELQNLYYKHWFHSGQLVTVAADSSTKDGALGRKIKAQISGISKNWGMLVADELGFYGEPTGKKFELQPDGNSFDMFSGMISKKV